MKFKKQFLLDLIYEDCEDYIAEKISDVIISHERWTVVHRMVFKMGGKFMGGKFYVINYGNGATEQQDQSPFEYEPELIECVEVEPKKVTITEYIKK